MKKLQLILIALGLSTLLYGQSHTPFIDGGYASAEEFIAQKPSFTDTLTIRRRTMTDIKSWGGNDYKPESSNENISKKVIKNDIWGICKNDTLYLNGRFVTELIWYARVEIFGKYCFLKPSFPVNIMIQDELGLNEPEDYLYMFGMLGVIGGAFAGAEMAVRRIPLILEIKTGKKMVLSKENICKLLDKYEGLKIEFEAENTNDQAVLLKYLTKVNEAEN